MIGLTTELGYRVPFKFERVLLREETILITLQEKEIHVSISPTPLSNKVLVSVSIDGTSIVHNKIRTFGEPFINKSYLFKGDFYILQKDDRDLGFDVSELGVRGELVYVDEREA